MIVASRALARSVKEPPMPRPATTRTAAGLLAVLLVAAASAWLLTRHPPPPEGVTDCASSARHGCMAYVPGGVFVRGAQAADPSAPNHDPLAREDEGPPREVEISPFWMHQYEVFADDFRLCVERGACRLADVKQGGGLFVYGVPERRSLPVNGVTWDGADAYCRSIGARLPTEAEWEFAARGGTRGWRWISSEEQPACPAAVIANGCGVGRHASTPNPQPPFAIGGLAGNLWEWTADWYQPEAYAAASRRDPTGPPSGEARVQRGGGWTTEDPAELRAAARASLDPSSQLDDVGFRCVVSAAKLP
jgi:formylglycine-generating enzyme required for sulfatase activity